MDKWYIDKIKAVAPELLATAAKLMEVVEGAQC